LNYFLAIGGVKATFTVIPMVCAPALCYAFIKIRHRNLIPIDHELGDSHGVGRLVILGATSVRDVVTPHYERSGGDFAHPAKPVPVVDTVISRTFFCGACLFITTGVQDCKAHERQKQTPEKTLIHDDSRPMLRQAMFA
jgi:hypothetical protein